MKILNLDDHPLFCSGLRTALIASGFDVTTVQHAKEAINFLQCDNDVDLLILDLIMPDMDGLSFMKTLNARNINTPVVIMSAKEDLVSIKEALDLGALGFIPKSWSVELLASALRNVNDGIVVIPDHIKQALHQMSKFSVKNTLTSLTNRQFEILKMVQSGLSNHGIGEVLCISERTVKSHLQKVFKLLGAKNRLDCVRKAEHLKILV